MILFASLALVAALAAVYYFSNSSKAEARKHDKIADAEREISGAVDTTKKLAQAEPALENAYNAFIG